MLIIKNYEWVRFLPDQRQPVYELCKRDSSQKEGVKTIKTLDKETPKSILANKPSFPYWM